MEEQVEAPGKKVSTRYVAQVQLWEALQKAPNKSTGTTKGAHNVKPTGSKVEWKTFPPESKSSARKRAQEEQARVEADEKSFVRGLLRDWKIGETIEISNVAERVEQRRKVKHGARLEKWRVDKEVILKEVENEVLDVSLKYKTLLQESDEQMKKGFENMKDESILIEMDEHGFQRVWDVAEEQLDARLKAITEYDTTLRQIESNRSAKITSALQDVVRDLVKIAYLLPDAIERLLEPEAQHVNSILFRNRFAMTEIIAKMQSAEAKRRDRLHTTWANQRTRWKELRHQRTIALAKAELTSPDWTNPRDRRKVLDELIREQTDIYNEAMRNMEILQASRPPTMSVVVVQEVQSNLSSLRSRSITMCDTCLRGLADYEKAREARYAERRAAWLQELAQYAAVDEEQRERDVQEQLDVIMKDLKEKSVLLQDQVSDVLQMEEFHIHKKCEVLAKKWLEMANGWESFLQAVDTLESDVTEEFDVRRDKYTETLQITEKRLVLELNELRSAPAKQALDETMQKVRHTLHEIETEHRAFNAESSAIAASHETKLIELLKTWQDTLFAFVGLRGSAVVGEAELKALLHPEAQPVTIGPRYDAFELGKAWRLSKNSSVYAAEKSPLRIAQSLFDSVERPSSEETPEDEESPEPVKVEETNAKKAPSGKKGKEIEKANEDGNPDADASEKKHDVKVEEVEPVDPDGVVCAVILKLELDLVEHAIELCRNAIGASLDTVKSEEIERVRVWNERRQEQLAVEIDQVLREHAPRLTRLEVDVRDVRAVQLDENAMRFDRYWSRWKSMREASQKQLEKNKNAVETLLKQGQTTWKQLRKALGTATSLARLQSLHTKYKASRLKLNEELPETVNKLDDVPKLLKSNSSALHEQFALGCVLLENGGTYHEQEIAKYLSESELLQEESDAEVRALQAQVEKIHEHIKTIQADHSFEEAFHRAQGDLAVQSGLGHTYGAPKRKASTRVREEYTRGDHIFDEMEHWCDELHALKPEASKTVATEADTYTCIVLKKLWKLRQQLHRRGHFIGIIQRQIDVPEIALVPNLNENEAHSLQPNGDMKVEHGLMDIVKQADAACREEMKQLVKAYYEQNRDRLTMPAELLPPAIAEHLEREHKRAEDRLEVYHQRYRVLVLRVNDLLMQLPKRVIKDITQRSQQELKQRLNDLEKRFESERNAWIEGHRFNEFLLKPSLGNPGARATLDKLRNEEDTLHEKTLAFIASHRNEVMQTIRDAARVFVQRLNHASEALVRLADSCVLLQDIDQGSEETAQMLAAAKERRGLKRLVRKANRDQQQKKEALQYQQTKSGKSDPKKGGKTNAEERLLLKEYAGMPIADLVAPLDEPINKKFINGQQQTASTICSTNEPNRATMNARNSAFAKFLKYLQADVSNLQKSLERAARDEQQWRANWERMVAYLLAKTDQQ